MSRELGLALPADVKRTSALRRVPMGRAVQVVERHGLEGDVCAFALAASAAPLSAEAVTGRAMTIAPGDVFLATPGHRESTRWVVGSVPDGGLVPGEDYWVLADCGAVGAFIGESPREKGHLGRVKFLGTTQDAGGGNLHIRQFALAVADAGADAGTGGGAQDSAGRSPADSGPNGHSAGHAEGRRAGRAADHGAPVFLVLGTSSEVGKTTAAVNILRALRKAGRQRVVALKATGTSSLTELHSYQDFGAAPCFDCVDFGLPTTYPSGRADIDGVFETVLDTCLAIVADAVLVECGGDIIGANVPNFLAGLAARRPDAKVILVASDSLAALGAKSVLTEFGLSVTLIAGPCTDTPTIQQRTAALCGIPALNLARGVVPALF